MGFRPLKKISLQEGLMALTRNTSQALLLSQFLQWTQDCYGFDEILAEENKERTRLGQGPANVAPREGWFYASLQGMADACMLLSSQKSLESFVATLLQQGWLEMRPATPCAQKCQYRVNLGALEADLKKIGYGLPGFTSDPAENAAPLLSDPLPQEHAKKNKGAPPEIATTTPEPPPYNIYMGQPYLCAAPYHEARPGASNPPKGPTYYDLLRHSLRRRLLNYLQRIEG